MLTPDGAREAADWYLAGQDARHPYASSLYADMPGLPRVMIQAGDTVILLDAETIAKEPQGVLHWLLHP